MFAVSGFRLAFQSAAGGAAFAILAALAPFAVYWFYRAHGASLTRRIFWALVALRTLAVIVLFLFFFRPVLRYSASEGGAPALVILLDNSRSMSIRDVRDSPSRFEDARARLLESGGGIWKALKDSFRVRVKAFSGNAEDVADEEELFSLFPDGGSTNITGALKAAADAARGTGPAASPASVLLISDGRDTTRFKVLEQARQLGIHINAVGCGARLAGAGKFRDVVLSEVRAPRFAPKGAVSEVRAFIDAQGYRDRLVTVSLKKGSREVDRAELVLDDEKGRQEAALKFTPEETGDADYTVEVEKDAEEAVAENNARRFGVVVTDPRIKALFVEGTLRFEYKYLKRLLERDPGVQFTALVLTSPGEFYVQGDAAMLALGGFPKTGELLDKFDVIIFGDIDCSFLDRGDLARLAEFVRKGKSFIMLGGYHSLGRGGYGGTAVGEMLPVELSSDEKIIGEELAVRLTEKAAVHPIFRGLEGAFARGGLTLKGANEVGRARPVADVLLDAPGGRVVFAVMKFGLGRTAVFSGSNSWEWISAKSLGTERTPYFKFWSQTVRWLAGVKIDGESKEPSFIAYVADPSCEVGGTARICARATDRDGNVTSAAEVKAAVSSPDGQVIRLDLAPASGLAGDYEASFEPPARGKYSAAVSCRLDGAELGEKKLDFEARDTAAEFESPGLDDRLLRDLASTTGGAYAPLSNLGELAEKLKADAETLADYRKLDPLGSRALFLVFVALMGAEWMLRKRNQLA